MNVNPFKALIAMKAVRAVKYALGIAGLFVVVLLVVSFGLDLKVGF